MQTTTAPSTSAITHSLTVPATLADKRLDQTLSALLPQYSRTLLQNWIKSGYVTLDHKVTTQQRFKVTAAQTITIDAHLKTHAADQPQEIKLDIIYEDKDIFVINKPVGLVVHPGAGCGSGTLLNALLYYAPELAHLPRAGIVHRLDKDTSGLLIVARNLEAHKKLVAALEQHAVKREYAALVWGALISGGTIAAPIGRHKTKRTLMAVVGESEHSEYEEPPHSRCKYAHGGQRHNEYNEEERDDDLHEEMDGDDHQHLQRSRGKPAVTHYRVTQRFAHCTLLRVILETGRTHQIRVHMAHIRHPLIGDPVYGGRLRLPPNSSAELRQFLSNFKRQALHAAKLTLTHPRTGKVMEFSAPLPQDMQQLLALLQTPKK